MDASEKVNFISTIPRFVFTISLPTVWITFSPAKAAPKKTKIKINETFYDERIINKDFDFIIDLNNEFIYDICSILNDMKGYYKVGFNHKYSDYFYNIQLEGNVLENSYNKFIFNFINTKLFVEQFN